MTWVLGLTGGIGAGKSVASAWFRTQGIAVLDADQAARTVVAPGTPGLAEVVRSFGRGVLDAAGALDRRALRALVLADPQARLRLEALLHPRIRAQLDDELARVTSPYAVLDAALLVESPQLRGRVQRLLVVDAPEAIRIARVMARDGVDRASASAMLAAQAPRDLRLQNADDVVDNSGTVQSLHARLAKLHSSYLELARTGCAR